MKSSSSTNIKLGNYTVNTRLKLTGLWYLAFIVLGVIGEFSGGSKIVDTVGYICYLAGYACFIVVALLLYKLFREVNRTLAILMVCFVIIGIAIAIIGEWMGFAVVAEIFWGLWLLPLGILILKSNLIPKVTGILLIVGCACNLLEFLRVILLADNLVFIQPAFYVGGMIAEFSLVLWLLIKGVKTPKAAVS